ncbi:MAG: transcription elongation factor GreA [Candidatus Omnitrophica bacterium]|nr:transcription elongation factor GreA [Candidatus Omnitrophota bacterium]
MKDVKLTRAGYEKLFAELDHLKKVKRREIAKDIGKAREKGDLSENAEYDAAREAQAHLEKRISELEDKLSRVSIIDGLDIDKNKVYVGATVKLKDLEYDEEIEYQMVSEEEADLAHGKLSITSPVGKALLGHKKGETVTIKVPAGTLKYKILTISR